MTAWAQFDSAPAFPGAEGYGRYTTGGRGGTVYHVTTLEDYCDNKDYTVGGTDADKDAAIPGSLRYGIKQSGARIIVFDVAGTIELKAPLKIQNDNITILGQTAPGDGICLKNYTLGIFANNVIVRYIRCRMGDEGKRYWNGGTQLTGKDQAFEDDAMNAYQKTGSEKHNIIIDHCSISWCVDECGSFYGNENFTLQWCILSESLRNSVHDKGAHGYGGIWGGSDASFHHNLLAHHDSRMIRFDHDYVSTCKGPVDYVNNVVYNWGSNSTYGGESSNGTYKKFNMVNNYYKPGPATKSGVKTRLLNPTTKCDNCTSTSKTSTSTGVVTPGHFYLSGNYMYGSTAVTNDNTCDAAIDPDSNVPYATWKSTCLSNSRFTSSAENHLNMHSAENAFNNVVSYAGASLKRDNVDTRIANETRNGTSTYTGSNGSTGGLIDTPSDVGGYPTLTGTKATDSDNDGIPDAWEEAHGLNKNSASDALTKTLDSRGYYTNIEVYANYLVQHITKAERAGATETFEEYYPLDDDPVDPTPDPTSVIVSPANKTIEVGSTLQFFAQVLPAGADQSVTWSSSDATKAEVSASGLVTAKATGTVKITATANGVSGVSDYCVLTVVEKQSGDGSAIVWDFTQMSAQTFTSGQTYSFTANDGSSEMTYTAGSSDKIEAPSNGDSHLYENGTTNSASTTRIIILKVKGEGKLSIYCKDSNKGVYECYDGSASGTKLVENPYTAYSDAQNPTSTSTINVTDDNGLFIKTTTKGYIYKIFWTPEVAPTTQTLTKHISSSTWASFVPEKSVVVPENVNVYYVEAGTYNSSAKTIKAVKIEAGTVIKGDGETGYIVNAAAEGDYEFEVSTDDAQTFSGNILACGKNETIAEGSLVFGRIDGVSGFYALDDYIIMLPVGIVYLPADVLNSVGSAPKAVAIRFDEVTSVDWFNTPQPQFNGSIFNINGQKVDANYKGIIIRNGRKYINK